MRSRERRDVPSTAASCRCRASPSRSPGFSPRSKRTPAAPSASRCPHSPEGTDATGSLRISRFGLQLVRRGGRTQHADRAIRLSQQFSGHLLYIRLRYSFIGARRVEQFLIAALKHRERAERLSLAVDGRQSAPEIRERLAASACQFFFADAFLDDAL